MRNIVTNDKLKKISKKDILFFFERLINDQNIIGAEDFRIEVISAAYTKREDNVLMKRLRIKFILVKRSGRVYYDFENYRAKDWSCVNSYLTKRETLEEITRQTKAQKSEFKEQSALI